MEKRLAFLKILCLLAGFVSLATLGAWGESPGVVRVGQFSAGGATSLVSAQGKFAYVIQGTSLTVLDLTDPTRATAAGNLVFGNSISSMQVDGPWLYVLDNKKMLHVVSLENPRDPAPVGRLQFDALAPVSQVQAIGKMVYLIVDGKLTVVDASRPLAPYLKGAYSAPGKVLRLARQGNLLCVHLDNTTGATPKSSLHLLEGGNPTQPLGLRFKGKYDFSRVMTLYDLAVAGNVVCYSEGLRLDYIDFSNPAAPRFMTGFTAATSIRKLVASGAMVYAWLDTEYRTVGGSTSLIPGKLITIDFTGARLQVKNVYDLTLVWGSYMPYVPPCAVGDGFVIMAANSISGCPVIDVRNPVAPRLASFYSSPTEVEDAVTTGSLMLTADAGTGLRIYDLRRPGLPALKGAYSLHRCQKVAVAGQLACVVAEIRDVNIVDISNPAAPRLRGRFHTAESVRDVAMKGSYAYVLTESSLQVLNLTDPVHPLPVATLPLNVGYQIEIEGNYVFIRHSQSIATIDISNPAAPQVACEIPLNDDSITQIKTAYGRVYAVGSHKLYILDGRNPFVGVLGQLETGDSNQKIALNGNRAYLINRQYNPSQGIPFAMNLLTLDISNPYRPLLVRKSTMSTKQIYDDVFEAYRGHLYLSNTGGLEIYRTSSVAVLSPSWPLTLAGGAPVNVHWKNNLPDAGTGVIIELRDNQKRVAMLGYDWSPTGENGRSFTLPLVPEGFDYRIRVISTWNSQLHGDSETPFRITGGPLRVISPNGGETWTAGTRQTVLWQINPQLAGGVVRFELWNGGRKVADLGAGVADTMGNGVSSVWAPPSVAPLTNYQLRIRSVFNNAYWDASDGLIKVKSQ